jgi:DNA-binding response OmpR family regulator
MPSASQRGGSLILVIDDDPGVCEFAKRVLAKASFETRVAGSGAEGAAIARSTPFDLLVVDLVLPDMLGTQVVRELRNDQITTPFVLVSAFLTTPVTVEAMKLGAANVVEKPISVGKLLSIVHSALDATQEVSRPAYALLTARESCRALRPFKPRSAAERWAHHVARACESDADLTTLESWAKFIGVSCSSLCESCRMLDIHPRDARDFARLLRALMQAATHRCSPHILLDVSDRRTLRNLTERAGLAQGSTVSVDQFFDTQQLIPTDHEGLRILRSLLSRPVRTGNDL